MHSRAIERPIQANTVLKSPQSIKSGNTPEFGHPTGIAIPYRSILGGGRAAPCFLLVMDMNGPPRVISTPPRLLDQLRAEARLRHYSYRTEEAHIHWVRRLVLHHGKRHPHEMGAVEVGAFLTHLAVDRRVSADDGSPVCVWSSMPRSGDVEGSARLARWSLTLTARLARTLLWGLPVQTGWRPARRRPNGLVWVRVDRLKVHETVVLEGSE